MGLLQALKKMTDACICSVDSVCVFVTKINYVSYLGGRSSRFTLPCALPKTYNRMRFSFVLRLCPLGTALLVSHMHGLVKVNHMHTVTRG